MSETKARRRNAGATRYGRERIELRRLDARQHGRPAKREARAEAPEQVVGAVERSALHGAYDHQRIAASGADGAGRGDTLQREAVVGERRALARGAPRRRNLHGGGRDGEATRVEPVDGLDPRSLTQHRTQARGEFVRRKAHDLARVRRVTDSHAASSLSRARHRTLKVLRHLSRHVSRSGAFFPYFGSDNIGARS